MTNRLRDWAGDASRWLGSPTPAARAVHAASFGLGFTAFFLVFPLVVFSPATGGGSDPSGPGYRHLVALGLALSFLPAPSPYMLGGAVLGLTIVLIVMAAVKNRDR